MTEEKLVERVTALFADSDAAQRKMIRLYAETNDAIEASAIIDSGAEVLHMLQGGLRPEVLVLDSVLSDTTIFPLLRSIRQQQIEYEPICFPGWYIAAGCAAYANSRLSTNRILL